MAKRKRVHPVNVPVDINGNVMRSLCKHHALVNGKDTFITTLALQDHYKYGSATRLILVDTGSGKTYPMFIGDFLDMTQYVSMRQGEILGEWGYCKKSSFFGVYLIEELPR